MVKAVLIDVETEKHIMTLPINEQAVHADCITLKLTNGQRIIEHNFYIDYVRYIFEPFPYFELYVNVGDDNDTTGGNNSPDITGGDDDDPIKVADLDPIDGGGLGLDDFERLFPNAKSS